MSKDNGCRIVLQCFLHNHPRVDGCTVDGALEQLLEGDDPVAIVQEDTGEHLELALTDLQAQIRPRDLRTGQGLAPAVAVCKHLQCQIEQGSNLPFVEVIGSQV